MAKAVQGRWWQGTAAFIFSVVLVVLAFVGTTTFVLMRSRGIGEAAAGITGNAVPSIERLLHARSEVGLLRAALERQVELGKAEPASRALVWRTVGTVRRDLAEYASLPSYPGEHEVWGTLLSSIEDLAEATQRVLAALDRGDVEGARDLLESDLRPASRSTERLLADSERMNAEQVASFAARMEALRAASGRDAVILNGLCTVLAAVLVTAVVQTARRQRKLQASLLRHSQERALEMEVFAGRVAHDILSPLTSASLALESLAKSSDEEIAQAARRGSGGIARVRSTVDGLLEFARAGAQPALESFTDLAEVATDVIGGLQESAAAAGVSLELRAGGGGLMVCANRGVLTSILTNLVQNAIRYIGEGPVKRVSVQVLDLSGRARVEVHDTGRGIPADLEQRIFEPYFRAGTHEATGLGLGLATVKRLVEAHRGRVGVQPGPGRGSIFWFELPAGPPPKVGS